MEKKLNGCLIWLIIGIIICILLIIVNKSDNDFIKNCTESGYSETYCINHK